MWTPWRIMSFCRLDAVQSLFRSFVSLCVPNDAHFAIGSLGGLGRWGVCGEGRGDRRDRSQLRKRGWSDREMAVPQGSVVVRRRVLGRMTEDCVRSHEWVQPERLGMTHNYQG